VTNLISRFAPVAGVGMLSTHASSRRKVCAQGFFDGVMEKLGMSSKPRYISPMEFYGLKTKTLEGADFSFDSLKGKTVLITNVASK